MKKILCSIFLLSPFFITAQIITTVAGNGIGTHSGDGGPAIMASLSSPNSVAIDLSTGTPHDLTVSYYISDQNGQVIRKVSNTGVISTYAGTVGLVGFSGDGGPATAARLQDPTAVAVDKKGNVYIADGGNLRIRKVSTDGTITTIAGNGTLHSGDGVPATDAGFGNIQDIDVDDKGNLYFTEYGAYVRKIDTFGIVTTVAGYGGFGYSGDGGSATAAKLTNPHAIAIDKTGNIYFSDGFTMIRKVDTFGVISTIAGDQTGGNSGDGGPASAARLGIVWGICVDGGGNIFVSDRYNWRIRKIAPSGYIYPLAGNGMPGCSGDGVPALTANFLLPQGIDLDAAGNLYIADFSCHVIRKVTPGTASINETNNPLTVKVYPNPATDALTIADEKQVEHIAIYDLMGRSVYSNVFHSQSIEINVADLSVGIYLVKINNSQTVRFVKE